MENSDEGLGAISKNLPDAWSAIPEPVQTSALKAFSRLIGGVGAYAAAWLRKPVQSVEDGTDAKSLMTRKLA